MKKITLLLICVFSTVFTVMAQDETKAEYNHWSIEVMGGLIPTFIIHQLLELGMPI